MSENVANPVTAAPRGLRFELSELPLTLYRGSGPLYPEPPLVEVRLWVVVDHFTRMLYVCGDTPDEFVRSFGIPKPFYVDNQQPGAPLYICAGTSSSSLSRRKTNPVTPGDPT